jgi:nucleoside-diphosphate-sugar epimerase
MMSLGVMRSFVHVLREARRDTELRACFLRLSAVLGSRDRADADHDVIGKVARALNRFQAGSRAQRDFEHLHAARMQCARHVFALLGGIER